MSNQLVHKESQEAKKGALDNDDESVGVDEGRRDDTMKLNRWWH